jgi:two-component system, cell cycle response regulator
VRRTAAPPTRATLLRAIAEHDAELHRHARAVAALATRVAAALGLDAHARATVACAAELHDLGKVAIPAGILHKPGPLDPEETARLRRHVEIGEAMMREAPALRAAAAVVRASHERWDGAGYPDGLAGAAIPLGARIVAVADAYAAMTAGRPYRAARTAAEALAELRSAAGTQFDPAVVDAWCAAHARHVLAAA